MIKKHVANFLTLTNFSLGMIAIMIVSADFELFTDNYLLAALLIMLAACMDRFDGKMARKLDTVSDLGKQLDSLSDLVSFGVAPALLTWKLHLQSKSSIFVIAIIYIVVLFFPLAGALRLAKFNIQEDPSYFVGIPITLAGALTAFINAIFILKFLPSPTISFVIVIIIGILAALMISPFKMKKR